MKLFLSVVIVLIGSAMAADLPKWGKLVLKNGREYQAVSVTQKRDDGIAIIHESGTARIKFEDLPEEVVKELGGFDPQKAATSRKNEAVTASAQAVAAEKVRTDKAVIDQAWHVHISVVQVLPKGVLCTLGWYSDKHERPFPEGQFHFIELDTKEIFDGDVFNGWVVENGKHSYGAVTGAETTVRKWRVVNQLEKVPKGDGVKGAAARGIDTIFGR